MTDEQLKQQWASEVSDKLVGRKIVAARYITAEEVKALGWMSSAILLTLDDGTMLFPQSDDEGNNAGAIATTIEDLPVIPVI